VVLESTPTEYALRYHLCVHVMCTNVLPVLLYTRYHLDFNSVAEGIYLLNLYYFLIFIYRYAAASFVLFQVSITSYSYSIFKLQITVSIFTI
jgi:hypothetical protein